MGSETRIRDCRRTLRFTQQEIDEITELASKCDLGFSAYMRQVALAYEPKSTIDARAVEELASLHGDIGRIGGLLKMWLSDNSKSGFGRHLNIPDLIQQLIDKQNEIGEAVRRL